MHKKLQINAILFLLVLSACASPVPSPTPALAPTSTSTVTAVPTSTQTKTPTITATITPTVTSSVTPTPTEISKVSLSADPLNPTRLTWEQVQGKNKEKFISADEFKFEGESTLGKYPLGYKPLIGFENSVLPPWVDDRNGFLSVNMVSPEVISENVHIDGWAVATSPEGKDVYFLQETIRGARQELYFWFAFSRLVPAWFDGRHGEFIFWPLSFKPDQPFNCPAWDNPYICDNRMQGDYAVLEEFIKTGDIKGGVPDGWFIPNPALAEK